MESLDWSNMKHDALEGTLIMPFYEKIQRPDSYSSIFTQWNSKSGILTGGGSGLAIPQRRPDDDDDIEPGISTNTGSFHSLDCFLSTSNSLTDTTSVEDDDGISRFFLDSNGPWNFTAVKPVPSVSLSGNANHGLDTETQLSQAPADKHTIINQSRSTGNHNQPNHNKPKRQNLEFHQSNCKATACHPAEIHQVPKKLRMNEQPMPSQAIDLHHPSSPIPDHHTETITYRKEMIYRAAVFRPVNFTTESVEKPKRKNVRISNDPQTVAARQRRERISERIRVLQKLVPGGSKMDTASMLDEAANYLKFLRAQVRALEALGHSIHDQTVTNFPGNVNLAFSPVGNYTFAIQNQNPVNLSKN